MPTNESLQQQREFSNYTSSLPNILFVNDIQGMGESDSHQENKSYYSYIYI